MNQKNHNGINGHSDIQAKRAAQRAALFVIF